MPKHKSNGYPRKLTLGKMKDRFRIHFSKDDGEKIFEAAAQGKELVFKITSDPSTLKEKSIGLLLEPIVINKEDLELYNKILDPIKKSKDKISNQDFDDLLDNIDRWINNEPPRSKKEETTGDE